MVVGGTSLFGGRGTVIGSYPGAPIVLVLQSGLTQAGIDPLYQDIVTGVLVIGDNGAGKSSLIKVLSGDVVPDSGEVLLDGRPVSFRSPSDAQRAGIPAVLISHDVPAVFEVADRIHIHRLGRRAAVVRPGDHEMNEVVRIMTGALPPPQPQPA